jgi:hypothetical protein
MDLLRTNRNSYKIYKVGMYLYIKEPVYASQYMCILTLVKYKTGDNVFVLEKNNYITVSKIEPLEASQFDKVYLTNVYNSDNSHCFTPLVNPSSPT